jgi:hypothetical protein
MRFLLALLTLIFPVRALSQPIAPAVEILSKEDARTMFSMSREQWLANVRQAVAAGAVKSMGSPEMGIGMAMSTPEGDLLMVRPSYEDNNQRPDFIQVTVGYRNPRAVLLTDSVLQDAIRTAQQQMKPDYEVIGNVERLPRAVSVFFTIFEK